MQQKKIRWIIILSIILAMSLIAIGGYFLYEKVFNKDDKINGATDNDGNGVADNGMIYVNLYDNVDNNEANQNVSEENTENDEENSFVCDTDHYGEEDYEKDFKKYSVSDFIGTYEYYACTDFCEGHVYWELKLSKKGTFVLNYPSACAGAYGIRGKYTFDENGLKLDPTHFIGYAGRSSEKDDAKLTGKLAGYKNVTTNIISKDILVLMVYHQENFYLDQVILERIK